MEEIKVGGEVRAMDGPVGSVEYVVRDSHSGEVSDFVVDRGDLGHIVLPLSAVDHIEDGAVILDVPLAGVATARAYDEQDFKACELEPHASESDKPLSWRCRYGADVQAQPAIAGTLPEAGTGQAPAVGRGTQVYSAEGPLALVDHILFDAQTGEVTHLVLAPGAQLSHAIVVPIAMVEAVTADGILIRGGRQELTKLGFYSPRSDEEIRTDVRQCLVEAGCDPAQVQARVDQGVVTLTGKVPDTATQRRVEQSVRKLEGVVDLESSLSQDSAVANAVTQALAADHRTKAVQIDVSVEHGVASLTGTVVSEEEKTSAEDVARQVVGVDLVINELLVDPRVVSRWLQLGNFVLHPNEWRVRGNWANWPGH